jgi:hemoglobin
MVAMDPTPFEALGGERGVNALAESFYEIMHRDEPALTQLHTRDPDGRVAQAMRSRFALFLIGWLGGPQEYMQRYGHPRLRMRHNHVEVNVAMRDAWLRAMGKALDQAGVQGPTRVFLDERFAQLADFMRNVEE